MLSTGTYDAVAMDDMWELSYPHLSLFSQLIFLVLLACGNGCDDQVLLWIQSRKHAQPLVLTAECRHKAFAIIVMDCVFYFSELGGNLDNTRLLDASAASI